MSRERNITVEEWQQIQRKQKGGDATSPSNGQISRMGLDVPRANTKARGMNKTEQAYAWELEARRQAGEILWWQFEGIRVRLADGAWYKPDFAVFSNGGVLSLHEIKGMWREAARVRIKVAAELHPFMFLALRKRRERDGGGWDREEFTAMLDRVSR